MALTVTVSTMGGHCVLAEDDGALFATVADLKVAIQDRHGVRRFQQRLMFRDETVGDDVALVTLGPGSLHLGLITVSYREDSSTGQALVDAIDDGQLGEVRRLLQLPANPNLLSPKAVRSPPIFIAARHGDPAIVELLVDALADPSAPCTCYSTLCNTVLGSTPLHVAVQHSDGDVVQILCSARADVNAVDGKEDTPLIDAVRDRHFNVIRKLVAAGAGVDHAALEGEDNLGNTALQKAAWKGDIDMMQLLLHLGADLNRPDEGGYTPLACSAMVRGDDPATRMLIAARADVNGGRPPPLAQAMHGEDRGCAQLLLEAGASRAKARAHRGCLDDNEHVYFVGHQNSDEQRRAVDAMVAAHNSDAEWLMWFHPGKTLAIKHRVEQPPELAETENAHYSWSSSIAHCTHGVLLENTCMGRDTTYKFMQDYIRTYELQLTVEYLDEAINACLRVLPSEDDVYARDAGRPPRCARSLSPRAVV